MPTNPTIAEVRELLDALGQATEFQSAIGGKILTARTLAALCRHFLANPMTAGEFANELARRFQDNIDHKRKLEATGTGKFAPITSEGWQFALGHLVMFAREHNITIVEPKK